MLYRTLLFFLLTCAVCRAQAGDSQPATSNVRGAAYPRVHADLRVTFHFKAPDAKKVQLQPGGDDNGLGKGPLDMTRGSPTVPGASPPRRRSPASTTTGSWWTG